MRDIKSCTDNIPSQEYRDTGIPRYFMRQVWFLCGWQVKLCDPVVTHGPYLVRPIIRRYTNNQITLTHVVIRYL